MSTTMQPSGPSTRFVKGHEGIYLSTKKRYRYKTGHQPYNMHRLQVRLVSTSFKPNAILCLRCAVRIIPFQIGIDPVVVVQRSANGLLSTIKLIHEALRIADGGLIAATEMIFQSDESSGRVVQIDGVCRPCPAFLSHFLEVFIPKLIHEIQMLDPFVEAVRQVNTKNFNSILK